MSTPAFCPTCGDTIGTVSSEMAALVVRDTIGRSVFTKPDTKGFFDTMDRLRGGDMSNVDPNASCRGTHGEPVRETIGQGCFGLVRTERESWPDGSSDRWKAADKPDTGLKRLLLALYIKTHRQDVFVNGIGWVFSSHSATELVRKLNAA